MKRKIIGFSIFLLLISICIFPSLSGNDNILKKKINDSKCFSSNEIEWWPMVNHDLKNTCFSSSETPSTNDIKWTFINSGISGSPIINNGKLYVPGWYYNLTIFCINTENGNLIKEYSVNKQGVLLTPTVYEEKLIVINYNDSYNGYSYLFCFDEANGNILWEKEFPVVGIRGSPVVYDDKIFLTAVSTKDPVKNGNCLLYCIDIMSGEDIWTYSSDEFRGPIISQPAINNDKVFIGIGGSITPYFGELLCLDAQNGQLEWSYITTLPIYNIVINEDNIIFQNEHLNSLLCFDSNSGQEIWRIDLPYHVYGLALGYEKIYCNIGRNLSCLDVGTGIEIWGSTPEVNHNFIGNPAIADGKTYICSCYTDQNFDTHTVVYCFDSNNSNLIWNYKSIGVIPVCSPVIADEKVYVSRLSNNMLYCFGVSDFQKPDKPVITGPKTGRIYKEYELKISTTDPNDYDVYYSVDWSGSSPAAWKGPYPSGSEISINCTYGIMGIYEIRVKAKNIHGAESEWSDPLVVSMPKSYIHNQIIELLTKIVKCFPFFEKILKQIIQ